MPRGNVLEVVLRRVFTNNTVTAHPAGRALPSNPSATTSNARMARMFFNPAKHPQGGN
jgi:hypothetical protein